MADTINTVKIKGKKRSTLALLLSIITLSAMGYLCYYQYYQDLKLRKNTLSQLHELDVAIVNNATQLQDTVTKLNKQLDALSTKVNLLSNNKVNVNNYQINNLIAIANQSLVVYQDINATIKILNYALNVVSVSDNPIYTELKVGLNTDIERLKQLPALDTVVIATRLNNIITSTDQLQLIVSAQDTLNHKTKADNNQSNWHKFLANMEDKLFGLIQISSVSKHDGLKLLPQNEVIIHQNVKLDILNARMALLQHDEANWQYSLKAAKQSLAIYFTASKNMQQIMDEIDQLLLLHISYSDVGINQTLNALNQLNNLSQDDIGT